MKAQPSPPTSPTAKTSVSLNPTVWSGTASGCIDDPNSEFMEGLRISSGFTGVEIQSEVYARDLGWLPKVGDGTYSGTMGENRPLEAIRLDLTSDNIPEDFLFGHMEYRVYVKDQGWTDWVGKGEVAGDPGSGNPIQAFEVKFVDEMEDLDS